MPSAEPRRGGASSWLANLALAAASLLFTLAVLEVGVRLFVDLDEQRPFGVYDVDHSNGGLSFLPGHWRRYETPEFGFEARYNRFGRRDVEWPASVVADPASVLFIGDSYAYGIGVDHDETIPSWLEARFAREGQPREVLNFGMPGSGAPPVYARLLDDAIAKGFRARTIVVMVFIGNDFYPQVLSALDSEPVAAASRTDAQGSLLSHWKSYEFLKLRVSHSARMVGLALTLGRLLGIKVYDSAGTYVFLREQTADQEALFRRILEHIGRMKQRCDETGRRLFAVILPNRIQVENREALTGDVYDATRPHRDILQYCEEIGLPCLDLLPVLTEAYQRDGEALFFPVDRHMTRRGNQRVSDAIGDFLHERGAP